MGRGILLWLLESNSDHHSSRPLAALDSRGVLRDIIQLVVLDASLRCRHRCIAPRSRSELPQAGHQRNKQQRYCPISLHLPSGIEE